MEQLIQVQILAQTIIEFSNAMTAGLEAVLGNKLSPSLVPENLFFFFGADMVKPMSNGGPPEISLSGTTFSTPRPGSP